MGWKAAQQAIKSWKILRGDKVMVLWGKDKGLTGTVSSVLREKNRVVVEGRNLVKRHVKRQGDNPGGIVSIEAPMHVSKVSLLDPVTGRPCRVTFRYTETGEKVRVSQGSSASFQIIPRPEVLKQRRVPRPPAGSPAGPKDTVAVEAHRVTYAHGAMPEEVGLPPVRFHNGRWELDVARMGPLVSLPHPVRDLETMRIIARRQQQKAKKRQEAARQQE